MTTTDTARPAAPPAATPGRRISINPRQSGIYVAFALTLWTVPTWTPDQLASQSS